MVHPWSETDLPNLALLCKYPPQLDAFEGVGTVFVHTNGEIVFVGPSGRALTSPPSQRATTLSSTSSQRPGGISRMVHRLTRGAPDPRLTRP